jgi:hypothetical protein
MQHVSRASQPPSEVETAEPSREQGLEEIEFEWDSEIWESRKRGPREQMPTLRDDDPLRHDLRYDFHRDPTRDSLPTLTDLDPVRHDSEIPRSAVRKLNG